jgi:outer membrane protein OmpA-like peptidoglycan-associated protein
MVNFKLKNIAAALLISGIFAGCAGMSKTRKGVIIGTGAGGAVGAGIGKAAGNTALGAIIGAAVGGVAGGIIGKQMDKQAEELAKIEGAEVERVGEGINVTFESGVLFGVDQSSLTSTAQLKIRQLGDVLNKYPETYILIEGHTDATGTNAHNMKLSQRRATSVSNYLQTQNVSASRTKTAWYGESQPKFPNDSDANLAKNRRVEFAIYANESMKEKAKIESGSN